MNIQEINNKQTEIINNLRSIKLMTAANAKRAKELTILSGEAKANGDYDAMCEIISEMEKVKKFAELADRMLQDNMAEARRFMVGTYGPLGGQMFDYILKQIEEASD